MSNPVKFYSLPDPRQAELLRYRYLFTVLINCTIKWFKTKNNHRIIFVLTNYNIKKAIRYF